MELSAIQLFTLSLTILIVMGYGIYKSHSIQSAEGFSLGGRSSNASLVAGAIAGTSIGGGATLGTAQMAFTVGISAWWFTLGMGIGFIVLALFYAKPLRNSALETVTQYLVLNYGKNAGPIVSLISSTGMFFACVSSVLPGIWMISAVLNISHYLAAIILMILIAAYVYFGGMKGASISGLWKAIIIWITLFIAGTIAFTEIYTLPNFHQVFSNASWFDLLSIGPEKALANLFAIVGGVVCSQTYIQALFSASDSKTASIGAISAAIITIPVGLPSIAIAMFMHVQQPDLVPMLVLPVFLIQYLNPVLGGIALGGIFLSIISSTAGQALSVGTLISKDIFGNLFNISNNIKLLWINRICILLVAAGVSVFSVVYINSQILDWNYLSMALRGGGIFLPLTIAIFKPKYLSSSCALWAMILSTIAALVAKPLLSIDLPPVFIGTLVSGFIIIIGIIFFKKHNDITIAHN